MMLKNYILSSLNNIDNIAKNFSNTIEKLQKRKLMFRIDTKSIKLKYGSLAAFMREEKIEGGVFYGLRKKTSISFQVGSKQHKAFNRIKALGFVNEIEKEIA